MFWIVTMVSCGGTNFLNKTRSELKVIPIDLSHVIHNNGGIFQDLPGDSIFSGVPGIPVSQKSMNSLKPDVNGNTILTDWDGDGVSNEEEELVAGFSNPYVAEYPRITTRIETPVTMELRVSETDITKNHTEEITDSDTTNTINNSMDATQYNELNLKTTPYVAKDSSSWSMKQAGSNGYTIGASLGICVQGIGASVGYTQGQNSGYEYQLSRSTSSEKTVFEDVDYRDNLNRNGVAFKNDTVDRVARNYRKSSVADDSTEIGPDAGIVQAGLYFVNESKDIPVRINNVVCTLSFRTPSGKCLQVKDFQMAFPDGSEFDIELYGGEEQGPYTVTFDKLNTFTIKNALRNGYVPQIHVVSYDLEKVADYNYYPQVTNLKDIETIVKKRTADIHISGPGMRESYRVMAFEPGDNTVSPGMSLKKALFLINKSWIGHSGTLPGESWDTDSEGNPLTVTDTGMKWKLGFMEDPENPGQYVYQSNQVPDPNIPGRMISVPLNSRGNVWSKFETFVKSYTDTSRNSEGNLVSRTQRIESIARLGTLKKYNPFSIEDNPTYDPNVPLEMDELLKMKEWIILHNGKYFEGDINDPIWAGDRYEIVFYDAREFYNYHQSPYFTPLQNEAPQDDAAADYSSGSPSSGTGGGLSSSDIIKNSALQTYCDFTLNTLWNKQFNETSNYSRSVCLGKVRRGETVKLQVELDEFRSLFNVNAPGREFEQPRKLPNVGGRVWQKFNYTLDDGAALPSGKPSTFTYSAWPGCNQITLQVQESAHAQYYTVSFWPYGSSEDDARTAVFYPNDLTLGNGFIIINRISRDLQGNTIGAINGDTYNVRVRAVGILYNVPLSTPGTPSTSTRVVVTNPPAGAMPGDFSFSAASAVNGIAISVSQGDDTEYYIARITGPYNYGHDDSGFQPPTRSINIFPGANFIPVLKTDSGVIGNINALTDDEKVWAVPGVYRVSVRAVNRHCLDANGEPVDSLTVPSQNDMQSALVDFNRYEEQKKYIPKRQIEEFNPRDVDLEVNFGEGSGWFPLRIGYDDYGTEERTIDCRKTTSFSESRGRVTIFFTPPTGDEGPQNQNYNVFRGGADEVEVYLRTVARPEYRDSVWLKSSAKDNYDPQSHEGFRCININSAVNDLPDFDPLKYWIMNDNTDVSMIESFDVTGDNHPRVFPGLGDGYTAGAGDFAVVAAGGKGDFFFSPMRYLNYKISASVVQANVAGMMSEASHVDKPEYRALGGEQKIKVSNLDSMYAARFEIGWKTKRNTSELYTTEIINISQEDGPHSYEIDHIMVGGFRQNLLSNEEYLVYVKSLGADESQSLNNYTTVKTIPVALAHPLQAPSSCDKGYCTIISSTQPLTMDDGTILLNGINYFYGQSLNNPLGSNIFDQGASGNMAEGMCLRIVESNVNILTSSITPYAMDLSTVTAPPADQCYIDPARKVFVLPRPSYWSRMNTAANVTTTPEIREEEPQFTQPNGGTACAYTQTGKFSRTCFSLGGTGGYDLKPFNSSLWLPEGTLSLWTKIETGCHIDLYLGDTFTVKITKTAITINWGGTTEQTLSGLALGTSLHHIYISWKQATFPGGTTVQVLVDGGGTGKYVTSSRIDWGAHTTPFQLKIWTSGAAANSMLVDNVKVWKYAVSNSPSAAWDYNSGTGVENGLHPIYGSGTLYQPSVNGVGFYTVPSW